MKEFWDPEFIKEILTNTAISIPIYLVILIGLGFSIFRYKVNPKASLLAISSLFLYGILQVYYFFTPFIQTWMLASSSSTESYVETSQWFYLISRIITTILMAIIWGLIITAVWTGRKKD